MHLNFKLFRSGLLVNNRFKLKYPSEIWENYPDKRFFLDNAAYANTVCSPLVAREKEARYNTSRPFIKRFIDESILQDIPSAVEDYEESTEEMLKRFKSVKYRFKDNRVKKPLFSAETEERAIVPFSCGKDSLLSLAVCDEIGLKPVAVYFNDTVSPKENRLKKKYLKKLGVSFEVVRNEIENLNDFEHYGKKESVVGYSHMVFNFPLLCFPLSSFFKAKYVVMGNELGLNYKFRNKDGIWCYPSYDQSFKGTKRMRQIYGKTSDGKIEVTSVVSPISDIVMMKTLHGRYADYGRFQASCACLDATHRKRWCHNCTDDMRFFLYMRAVGKDPRTIGINENLFEKKYFKYHVVFNPAAKERYDKTKGNDEELKFAYYLAYKNGAKGFVIDKFKEMFLDEVRANEDRLYKMYFKIENASLIPKEIKKKVLSIYKEEIAKLF